METKKKNTYKAKLCNSQFIRAILINDNVTSDAIDIDKTLNLINLTAIQNKSCRNTNKSYIVSSIVIVPFAPNEISVNIRTLNCTTATGYDEILTNVIKYCNELLITPLSY